MSSGALPQRRQHETERVQAIQEVLTERARPHGGVERHVRGGNDAYVHVVRRRVPEAPHLPGLERPEQCRLNRYRQRRDLVQEQRAPMRHIEEPRPGLRCTGERAAAMAEQLAFDQ